MSESSVNEDMLQKFLSGKISVSCATEYEYKTFIRIISKFRPFNLECWAGTTPGKLEFHQFMGAFVYIEHHLYHLAPDRYKDCGAEGLVKFSDFAYCVHDYGNIESSGDIGMILG